MIPPSPVVSGDDGQRRDPGEGRRSSLEAMSSGLRLAPSPGAPGSNGISRRAARPRIHKAEHEHRRRGSRPRLSERSAMRFVGVDIGGKAHVVAMVDEAGRTLLKPMAITEDAAGYTRLREVLGDGGDTLVVLEATGHYWQNLFAVLTAAGFAVAVVNPLRTQRFAEEDLRRSKTDAIDALGLAHFGRQKRPEPTRLPDRATEELRELVHLRDRLVQDIGDRVRQLHRLVDLGFPEFTRHVAELDSPLATAILCQYPTAARLVARVGDPAAFPSAGALAAFVGVVPGLRQSGQRQGQRAGLHPLGHARLRAQLWMPTLNAIRFNPWLRAYYQRLLARGKVRKVAIVAAMRKLLIAVYAVAKSRRPFVPHVISQETPA